MKFTYQKTSKIKLNLFENKLVYLHNENDADVKLPLKVTLISKATSYINKQQCLLDYSPTTLGYYWIDNNKCLRTTKGLVFKRTKKEQAVQAQLSANNKLLYQIVDWQKSIKPTDKKEYTFDKISQINGILNKTDDNTWYLKIGDIEFTILKDELEFSFKYDSETGFELIDGSISYYDRPLTNVDVDSFKVLNCNYSIDKNTAFCGNDALPNVDIATFKALTYSLAKDKNKVYHSSSVLKHADPQSLQLFKDHTSLFYKDKNYVYQGDSIVIGADVATFKTKGEMFGIDKNHVYRFSKQVQHIDVTTFEIINDTYFKDKDHIYRNFPEMKVCENDASFKDLTNGYFKFKKSIYYMEENKVKISNDSSNFKVLPYGWAKDSTTLFFYGEEVYTGNTSSAKIISEHYASVDKKVFWQNEEIKNADADTFVTDVCDFAMDKNHLYHAGEQIKGADPSSFKQLNEVIFKDKSNIYLISGYDTCFLHHIKNINTSNIEILQKYFFKNNDVVYCDDQQIAGADPLSFEVLQGAFSRDKNSVYYYDEKLLGLNPQEFKVLNYQFGCDKKYVFFNEHKLDLDAQYSILLSDDFIKDQRKVYYQNTLIKKADAQSFEVISHWFQKDKHRLFHQTTPLELNPHTAKIKEGTYAFDESNAYFVAHKIKGVDILSYEVLGQNFSRDKYHLFFRENAVKENVDVDVASFQIVGTSVFQDRNNVYTFKHGELVVDRKLNSI